MLNKHIFMTTVGVSESLATKNKKLMPMHESPLSGLTNIVHLAQRVAAGNLAIPTEPLSAESAVSHLQVSVCSVLDEEVNERIRGVSSNTPRYSEVLDEISTEISKVVNGQISLIRNVVQPAVASYYLKVRERYEVADDILGDFSIIEKDLPAPMKCDSFREPIANYADVTYLAPEARACHLSHNIINQSLLTGSKETDTAIAIWSASPGISDIITNVFDVAFGIGGNLNGLLTDPINGTDASVALMLFSRKFTDEVPDGLKLGTAAWTELLNNYKRAAGVRVYLAYSKAASQLDSGLMVTSATKRSIVVFKPLYEKWLEENGHIETLLGMLVHGTMQYTIKGIDRMSAEYAAAWSNYVVHRKAEKINNDAARLKTILGLTFNEELNMNLSDVEKSYYDTHAGYIDGVVKRFTDELAQTKLTGNIDLSEICIRLLCRSRFAHTPAETILIDIDQNANAPSCETGQPEITEESVKAASLAAVVNYVTDYVYSMCVNTHQP